MQPSNSRLSVRRISAGSIQLLVGPASSCFSLGMKVPASTSSAHKRSYSACEPSHQNTRSGLVSRATSDTHLRRPRWRTQVGVLDWSTGTGLGAFIASTPERQTAQRWAGPVRGRLLGADSSTRVPAAALPVDAGAAQ